LNKRKEFSNVIPCRQLRHNPSIRTMNLNLRGQSMGKQPLFTLIQSDAGVIT
jgi:hypothetical protein